MRTQGIDCYYLCMEKTGSKPQFIAGFNAPLTKGVFIKRYKRFFADIHLPSENKTITVHCANTGSMKGLNIEGSPALISKSDNPKRKLQYTLECLKPGKSWVCVNTHRANAVVKTLLENKKLPGLKRWSKLISEPRYSDTTRFDFLLEASQENQKGTYVEVKSVTLSLEKGIAEFPDAVTLRGLKHLECLSEARKNGFSCYMVYLVFRGDCKGFRSAKDIDPNYAKGLLKAKRAGVKVITPAISITEKGFYLLPENTVKGVK